MNGDVLVAHQVLSGCNALGDLDVVVGSTCAHSSQQTLVQGCKCTSLTQPDQLRAELGLFGVDAEPNSASRVPGVDVLTFRYFGEV
jgi:hypothetical protein